MNLSEFEDLIVRSEPEDWTNISCWGAGSGPSFMEKFDVWTTGRGEFNNIEIDSHANIMSFKKDLLVSVAYGISHNNDFREEWANKFPDRHASSAYVDFFYARNLVYRDIYVAVDGGRCLLPLPKQNFDEDYAVTALTVSRRRAKFFRLLNGLHGDYDGYLDRAGIQFDSSVWMA